MTRPEYILRGAAGAYDIAFANAGVLLSGTTTGDIEVWELEDRRVVSKWHAAEDGMLSVQGLDGGRACLSQGKDGSIKVWDIQSCSPSWQTSTGSCSFARAVALPQKSGADGLDALDYQCYYRGIKCPSQFVRNHQTVQTVYLNT